jgi:hypothetical protein
MNFTEWDAIKSLTEGSLTIKADGNIIYHDNQTPPTKAEIDAEIIRIQAEYDALDYARKRQAEYPAIADLVVALYDTDDKSAIETKRAAVKAKYPKP